MMVLCEATVMPELPALSLDISVSESNSIRAAWVYSLGHRDGWRAGLVVRAPVVLVDGDLARRGCAPGRTPGTGSRAGGVSEIESLAQDDDSRLAVTEVRD